MTYMNFICIWSLRTPLIYFVTAHTIFTDVIYRFLNCCVIQYWSRLTFFSVFRSIKPSPFTSYFFFSTSSARCTGHPRTSVYPSPYPSPFPFYDFSHTYSPTYFLQLIFPSPLSLYTSAMFSTTRKGTSPSSGHLFSCLTRSNANPCWPFQFRSKGGSGADVRERFSDGKDSGEYADWNSPNELSPHRWYPIAIRWRSCS